MLGSRFSPDGFRIDGVCLFNGITLIAHMSERIGFIFDAKLMLKLTAAVAHQAFYHPSNWGGFNRAHAAVLIVCAASKDG